MNFKEHGTLFRFRRVDEGVQTFVRNKCQLINNVSADVRFIVGVVVSINCRTSTFGLPFGVTGCDSVGGDALRATAEVKDYH